MSYQDLHYLILKLLTKNYGLSNHKMALGVKVSGLEYKVGIHCFFYSDFMYLNGANLQMVKEMSPLFVSYDIFPKRAEILKKNCLLNKFITGGPFFMHHPVLVLEL